MQVFHIGADMIISEGVRRHLGGHGLAAFDEL